MKKSEAIQEKNAGNVSDQTIVNPINVYKAGSNIRKGVRAQVFSVLFNILGAVSSIWYFMGSLSTIASGGSPPVGFAAIGGFFFFLGFIFWIISLSNYDLAGVNLKKSRKKQT